MSVQNCLKFLKKYRLFFIAGIFVFLSAYCLAAKLNHVEVSTNASKKFPIYRVDTKEKKVAITFDTNWGTNNTKKVLDILDKYNAKATFFLMGTWVDKHHEETKEIFKRGHEIGNHSNSHADFTLISESRMIEEIAATDAKLIKLIGKDSKIFRFPSGSYNEKAVKVAEDTNHFCIQWDVDSIDWKERGADIEYNRVMKNVKPGSIILFHDNAKYTPDNLIRIIGKLQKEGYKFVTVSNLIYKDNYYIDNAGAQKLN
ncbi:polysaccharide deacetylase [Clostridium novyi A str. 4552]|uniref:Polysaccharide deacetylase n=1 Tax=Clostridium novyi A str. 4552 TaxID=1444289 RepID=A0A0A0I9S2_CLONO|nr:polysaccharide deacetylase family sporulation protein PdaB [Clostridium novyi]KGM97278.1 polysaccharide deacetylase [Clostridium novyi A str. 4552]